MLPSSTLCSLPVAKRSATRAETAARALDNAGGGDHRGEEAEPEEEEEEETKAKSSSMSDADKAAGGGSVADEAELTNGLGD